MFECDKTLITTHFLKKDRMKCQSDLSFSWLLIEKCQIPGAKLKNNFFTRRKIINFYSRMEKHKIFEKRNKDFLPYLVIMLAPLRNKVASLCNSCPSRN